MPPKVRRPQARVIDAPAYTIHDFYQKPFTMQLPLNPTSIITKTTIVCFKEEPHASKFARMLEGHKAINKAWPCTVFDEYTSLNLYAWDTQHFVMGDELYIMKWNFQDLRNYCADNILDMMYIKSLKERGREMSLTSDLIRLEMDHAFYVNRFTVMWSRE